MDLATSWVLPASEFITVYGSVSQSGSWGNVGKEDCSLVMREGTWCQAAWL